MHACERCMHACAPVLHTQPPITARVRRNSVETRCCYSGVRLVHPLLSPVSQGVPGGA
jgi:hypothetical protein